MTSKLMAFVFPALAALTLIAAAPEPAVRGEAPKAAAVAGRFGAQSPAPAPLIVAQGRCYNGRCY